MISVKRKMMHGQHAFKVTSEERLHVGKKKYTICTTPSRNEHHFDGEKDCGEDVGVKMNAPENNGDVMKDAGCCLTHSMDAEIL